MKLESMFSLFGFKSERRSASITIFIKQINTFFIYKEYRGIVIQTKLQNYHFYFRKQYNQLQITRSKIFSILKKLLYVELRIS